MIKYLTTQKHILHWIIFHALLGVMSSYTPWILIFWFYAVLLFSLSGIFKTAKRRFVLNWLMVYQASFEILSRMAGTSPFIPYELGKYLLFVFLLYGIILGNNKGAAGILMFLLLVPGMFAGYLESGIKAVVFNALGPVNIALGIVYFTRQSVSLKQFISYLRLLMLPLISVLFFTLIKSPDLNEIEFRLGANFETIGGFGSNQISTVFGAALFILFIFVWNKWKFTPYRWLDIFFLILFSFRGLLSFSRGGMIGGFLAILILLIIRSGELKYKNKITTSIKKIFIYIPLLFGSLLVTFFVADDITGGMLSLRYQGETAGTQAGTKDKTLTTITSNRSDIFIEDIEVFTENPFLGVGVGQSREYRKFTSGQLPHIELSRLLSEHGLFGLIYFLLLLWQGFNIIRHRHRPYKNILFAFFVLALYTTFHAATRTYFTPLFLGLSMINIVDIRKKILRISKENSTNNTKTNNTTIGVQNL